MAIHNSDSAASAFSASPATPLTDEARATALWTFVRAQAPHFSLAGALDVVRALHIDSREDCKELAKRLRKELQARRIKLKQVNALQAVARLAGHSSWHSDASKETPRLRLEVLIQDSRLQTEEFASWSQLADALRVWADKWLARGQLPLGVLTMRFTGRMLSFTVPVPTMGDEGNPPRNEIWHLGSVAPISDEDHNWLAGAPAALEKLRRHLEETGRAVLDGYAALYLCANTHDWPGSGNEVTATDVVNSELVLLREPDEDDPHSGFEIARGDELTCWHQLEVSLRDDRAGAKPDVVNVSIPDEGVGAWFVNGVRHVWALETLKPNEYLPGRVHSQLGIDDCERLLRRYKLARRIHSGGFRHHDMTKHVDYLSGLPETWRVDLHRILHLMQKANFTWEGYIEKFGAEQLLMTATLPVGFVMQLLENLQVEKPNAVFAWPTLAEMALVTDDQLMCSLMPRVDAVRYAKPSDLSPQVAASLREAVDEFSSGLHLQKMVSTGAITMERELPYLVYANDAQELRLSAEAMGLQVYVAVSPHLIPTAGVLPETPDVKVWPWALGHALLLRFEHARGGAQ